MKTDRFFTARMDIEYCGNHNMDPDELYQRIEIGIHDGMLGDDVEEFSMEVVNDPWLDNEVQFARLLCELVANNESLNLEEVAESMDLELSQVQHLLDRADAVFEKTKKRISGVVK